MLGTWCMNGFGWCKLGKPPGIVAPNGSLSKLMSWASSIGAGESWGGGILVFCWKGCDWLFALLYVDEPKEEPKDVPSVLRALEATVGSWGAV